MRGRVPSCREIAVPPDPEFRLVQAPALGRPLPVGAGTRELGSWLAPLLLIAIASVGGAILAGGLPAGPAGPATVGLLAIAAALAAAGLSGRVGGRRVAVPALVGVGMCGAGLDLLADGTGYVIGYMAVAGLALRTPPRVAVLAGSPVVAAIAGVEATDAANPAANSLSVLAVQLEAARLTAITEAAGANLVGQITAAHKQTCVGILNARRALAMLRDDEPPGPASLPRLVSETAAALGVPIALEVDGVPRPLDPEAGLMLYRVVQEALTNVAKHAGRGVRVTVRLAWAAGGVEVSVVDSGGDGSGVGLPSGGLGLTGMTERAELRGGRLRAGRSDDGFAVRLWLPASTAAPA